MIKKANFDDVPNELKPLKGFLNVNNITLNDIGKEFLDNYGNPVSSVYDLGKDG